MITETPLAPGVAAGTVDAPSSPKSRVHRPAELLTAQEVLALLRACSRRAPTGIRNQALLTVLYRGGLRIAEALALEPRDLDPEAGTVNVRCGKGGRQRVVALDPQAWAVVMRWMDRRHQLGLNGHQRVFCTLHGGPVLPSYVRALLPRLARRAGVEKRVHAHGLRHQFAVELTREGVAVQHIQKLLGHASPAVTAVYLSRMAPEESLAFVRRRAWSA